MDMIEKTISHYLLKADSPPVDNVGTKHLKEEFLKDLSNKQKNASPLLKNHCTLNGRDLTHNII